MSIFGPLVAPTTSAVTVTLASAAASLVTVSPSTSSSAGSSTVSPGSPCEPVDLEDVADGDLLLAAASAHDRVHRRDSLLLTRSGLALLAATRDRGPPAHAAGASTTAPWHGRRPADGPGYEPAVPPGQTGGALGAAAGLRPAARRAAAPAAACDGRLGRRRRAGRLGGLAGRPPASASDRVRRPATGSPRSASRPARRLLGRPAGLRPCRPSLGRRLARRRPRPPPRPGRLAVAAAVAAAGVFSTGSVWMITPRPLQCSQVSANASSRPCPIRLRVIWTRPSEVTSATWCLVRSRPRHSSQPAQHQVAVGLQHHVDEVDDDDAADVAQPQLADDLLGRLEVVLGDGLLEVAARSR